MKKVKDLFKKILKKIKKSSLVQLIKYKATIKELLETIRGLEKDKKDLIDKIKVLENEKKELSKTANKVPGLEILLQLADKSLKDKIKKIKELDENRINIENQLFDTKQDLARVNIELDLKNEEIDVLKSNRYLVKKIPSGRTPNTNKTKISKPMSARVTKYMRGEHE